MSLTDYEQNDGLDALTSEELEEQVFGPDPDRKRRGKRGSRGLRRGRPNKPTVPALPAPRAAPAEVLVTRYCYACGAEGDARAEVCPRCGVRQPAVPAPPGAKHKGAATLLALTLGGVGAHRFYLGQWKTAAVMLVLCWTFLPAVVGVVDFVRYVLMSDREFAARYDRAVRPALGAPSPPHLPSGVVSGPRAVRPTVRADDPEPSAL